MNRTGAPDGCAQPTEPFEQEKYFGEESQDDVASDDERSVDDLFAELPEDGRRTLEQVGMGLPELRRIAAGEGGLRQVRGILSEFTATADRRRRGDDEGPVQQAAVWPWLRLLLVAVAGVVVCEVFHVVIGGLALLVGVACGVGVIMAALKTRESGGGLVLRWATVAAYFLLIVVASYASQEWYLQLRGTEQTVTIAEPSHEWSHGARQTYCRVRLTDGTVHRVFSNRENCAGRVGERTTAVVDPSGRYGPFLGTKSQIDDTVETAVALCALGVLVLAPACAVALGRNRTRRNGASGATA